MEEQRARQLLEQERSRLMELRSTADLADLSNSKRESFEETSAYDQHPADLGTETFERAKSVSILARVESGIGEVETAIERLRDGRYGICEACGRPIDDARLEAVPAARFCVEDQSRAERGV